jgi:uncharacterized protein (TIGR02145 family)/uncharacterized repeat protein (TIGR02543 family)
MKKRIILLLAALMALLQCSDSGFERDNPWDEGGTKYNGGYWTLTINKEGDDCGRVSPAAGQHNYDKEISVTVSASTDGDCYFIGWLGELNVTNANVTITMDGNKTLTAHFQQTFVDVRDNKTYRKVAIGGQTWMAENLNYDVEGTESDVCYGGSADNCDKYGRLYDWSTAMGIDASYNSKYWNGSDVKHQGVCPVGWHIPSDDEWSTLVDYVGGWETAGTKLMSRTGWNRYSGVPPGSDVYGFAALPGGSGGSDGYFHSAGYYGFWWSATEGDDYYARGRLMIYDFEDVGWSNSSKTYLYSVRCVEDGDQYTVTFDANRGTGTSPDAQTVNAGSPVTMPNEGGLTMSNHTFGGWNTNTDGTGTNYGVGSSYTFDNSITLYAKWNDEYVPPQPIKYTLTIIASDGGMVSPLGGEYEAETAVNILANPNSGYTFTGWTVTTGSATFANANDAATTVTLSSNATISANFQKNDTPPEVVVGTLVDSRDDGKTYRTVTISGGGTWMAENLNYAVADSKCYGEDGYVYDNESWKTLTSDEMANNCAKYGRLYYWSTAMGIDAKYNNQSWNGSDVKHQGICPVGWHIPSDAEWTALENAVGGSSIAGRKLKSQNDWYECGPVGSGKSYVCEDEYGWSALPGGFGDSGGSFSWFGSAGSYGVWWSATERYANYAWNRFMNYNYDEFVYWTIESRPFLFSVRCVQD